MVRKALVKDQPVHGRSQRVRKRQAPYSAPVSGRERGRLAAEPTDLQRRNGEKLYCNDLTSHTTSKSLGLASCVAKVPHGIVHASSEWNEPSHSTDGTKSYLATRGLHMSGALSRYTAIAGRSIG